MKIAIISDIHGNFEAFKNVLADIDTSRIDKIICLGDCIGYGPEPQEVVSEVRRRKIPTIIGNHELAVFDRDHLNWFNPMARSSIEKTITLLDQASLDFIHQLPRSIVGSDYRCVHGYPPDSARTYLFQKPPYQLIKTFKQMAERICFVGHTHDLEMIQFDGRQVEHHPLGEGTTPLDPEHRFIINVGSVGQPRDGSNHAKYAIYCPDHNQIDVRYITYDIAATVAKIKAVGLPETHAQRLW